MTQTPRSAVRSLLAAGLWTGLLALCVDRVVEFAQRRPPVFRTSAELGVAEGDRAALEAVAALGRLAIVASKERLALSVEGGAEVLELFHVNDDTNYASLEHVSPVVRAYSAVQIALSSPEKIGRLRGLLGDKAHLAVGSYDNQPDDRTVGEVVVSLLCRLRSEAKAMTLLKAAAEDWRLLAVRTSARQCLASYPNRL